MVGPLRRPPQQVLDRLKELNTHYKIGHLLCRSRKPDFLLDILQRQGTNQVKIKVEASLNISHNHYLDCPGDAVAGGPGGEQ